MSSPGNLGMSEICTSKAKTMNRLESDFLNLHSGSIQSVKCVYADSTSRRLEGVSSRKQDEREPIESCGSLAR